MARLLRSFFYKLFRDWTFRIVALISIGLAVLFSIVYGVLLKKVMGAGVYGLVSSISPSQNFGLAVPINLAIFTTTLFSQGIIRNQVIVGNSKTKVYFSLLIGGLVFTLSLMLVYVGLNVGLLTIFSGGFYNNIISEKVISGAMVARIIVITILNYVLITSYAIFISSSTKSNGASISLVIIPIVILSVFSLVIVLMSGELVKEASQCPDWLINLNKYINPQYAIGKITGLSTMMESITKSVGGGDLLTNEDFAIAIVNNLSYTALFTLLGVLVFNKKDLK